MDGEDLSTEELLILLQQTDGPTPPDPLPLFGGEMIYQWAADHRIEPGPCRSAATPAFRQHLESWCRKNGHEYPWPGDDRNYQLGLALKSLGLIGFYQQRRVAGTDSILCERVYEISSRADPQLLDPRFSPHGGQPRRRGPTGTRNGFAKHGLETVRRIKVMLREGRTAKEIADVTGVSIWTVKSISCGRRWASVRIPERKLPGI